MIFRDMEEKPIPCLLIAMTMGCHGLFHETAFWCVLKPKQGPLLP